MPTIFIECTSTSATNLNTGIQRVVRNILRHAPAAAAQYGYAVQPVRLEGDSLIPVDAKAALDDTAKERSEAQTAAGLRQRSSRALKGVAKASLHGLAVILPFDPVRRFVYGPAVRQRFSQLTRPHAANSGDAVASRPGDILLLPDTTLSQRGLWQAIRRFQKTGGYVVGVIYDLIPLDNPSECLPEHVATFRAWSRKIINSADAFAAISGWVASRMLHHIREQDPSLNKPVGQFYLGCGLDLLDARGEPRAALKEILASPHHVFIVVGSIEPRKNHMFVLNAFERFWSAGGEAPLIVIGQPAWKSESIMHRMSRHPELGRKLHVLSNVSDAELDYAYRHASALISASKAEGFGLPIVESFSRGLPVICSDIPVFREIADGKARFFALDDPGKLAAAITRFTQDYDAMERRRSAQPWLSWAQSTDQLMSVVTKLIQPLQRSRSSQ